MGKLLAKMEGLANMQKGRTLVSSFLYINHYVIEWGPQNNRRFFGVEKIGATR